MHFFFILSQYYESITSHKCGKCKRTCNVGDIDFSFESINIDTFCKCITLIYNNRLAMRPIYYFHKGFNTCLT